MRATLDSITELTPLNRRAIAPCISANSGPALASHVQLPKGAIHSRHLEVGEAVAIRVFAGICWATLEGDPADHVIEPGSITCLAGPGLLVIEGLSAENAVSIELLLE